MRKPRQIQNGSRYHVSARANRKEMIMDAEEMKDLFLIVLARAKHKFNFRIENFCIMGNHFHLIIQPMNGANLSSIMQWILSVFAMTWNRQHKLTGHVWGERFFSRIITSIIDYLRIAQYINENPVKAGQTERSDTWRHGGLWHWIHGLHWILDEPQLI